MENGTNNTITTELESSLSQFRGTDGYHGHMGQAVLTDGAKFLADQAPANDTTFDEMLAACEAEHDRLTADANHQAEVAAHRAAERARGLKYAKLIAACLANELESTDCPRCQENSYVRDDAGKRDICLECEFEVLDSYYVDCAKFADTLAAASTRKGAGIATIEPKEVA